VLRKSPPCDPRLANTTLRRWTLRRAAACHLSTVVGIGSRWRIVQCKPFGRPCLSISNDPLASFSQPAFSRRATYGLIFFHVVNKIIIAQDPLKRFINTIRPGAYAPITKVDPKVLDTFIIRLVGMCGSEVETVRLLRALNAVGEDLCVIFFFFSFLNLTITSAVRRLLLLPTELGGSRSSLSSGLCVITAGETGPTQEHHFVICWPEDSTWDDSAASRPVILTLTTIASSSAQAFTTITSTDLSFSAPSSHLKCHTVRPPSPADTTTARCFNSHHSNITHGVHDTSPVQPSLGTTYCRTWILLCIELFRTPLYVPYPSFA